MKERQPELERINTSEVFADLPKQLRHKFNKCPIYALGSWNENQLSLHLRWKGGYSEHLDPEVRNAVGKEFRQRWQRAVTPKEKQLSALKDLPMEERKKRRKEIMPFPGVVMTFEDFEQHDNQLVIKTRIGNYAQIHPAFGVSSPSFAELFPGQQENLWKMARGIATSIITETSDGYHIFSVKSSDLSFGGYIGTPGMTPNLSDQEIQRFMKEAQESGTNKEIEIPGSWFFELVKNDISEPNELDLESGEINEIYFIEANSDENSGWMNLNFFCKIGVTAEEIDRRFSQDQSEPKEYSTIIFAKNNPGSLATLLSRPNVYYNNFGAYHAYFRIFYPEILGR